MARARRSLAVAVSCGAVLVLAGCATAGRPSRLVPNEPGATFAVAGPTLGSREIRPSGCIAGGHYQFLGADLVDEKSGLVVRTVEDPLEGPAVRVFDAADSDRRTVAFRRPDCSRLAARFAPTGSMVNGVLLLKLDLALDCRNAAGDAVAGTFSASECR